MPEGAAPTFPEDGLIGSAIADYWRDYAFWATGTLSDEILATAKDAITKAMAEGAKGEDLITALDTALGEYLPPTDSLGRTTNRAARIENIARTNVSTAVNAGRLQAFQDPDLREGLKGLMYSAVLDSRTRDSHAAWDQVVQTPEFWAAKGVPPSGWNCRCFLTPVSIIDTEELTPEDQLPKDDIPDAGFDPLPQ